MDIEWPGLDEDQLEPVNEDTLKEDPFQRDAFRVTRTSDGGAALRIKLVSEVQLPAEVLNEMLNSVTFDTDMSETVMQRLLVELNIALLPLMRFKIEEFKNKVLRLN